MPTDPATKQSAILTLIASSQQAYRLHALLVLKGADPALAAQSVGQSQDLDDRIDQLIAASMDDWISAAPVVTSQIRQRSADVQKSITEIEHDVQVMQHAVEALGYVDKIVSLAATLIA